MQMNGPDRPKSNLSHFSGLNKVWPGRSPQAIKPDDVLRCQTACSRMRATTVGDGQAEPDLIAPWRVPDGQFSGGAVASSLGRSAERRVGEECGSTCRYRWAPE